MTRSSNLGSNKDFDDSKARAGFLAKITALILLMFESFIFICKLKYSVNWL